MRDNVNVRLLCVRNVLNSSSTMSNEQGQVYHQLDAVKTKSY